MSLASELGKLKELKDSGAITQEVFEQLRNRLLDECVRRIEALHDQKPMVRAAEELAPIKVIADAVPDGVNANSPQGDGKNDEDVTGRLAASYIGWELPPVKVAHGTVQHIRFLAPEQEKPLATAAGAVQKVEVSVPSTLHAVAAVGVEIRASTTLHSIAAARLDSSCQRELDEAASVEQGSASSQASAAAPPVAIGAVAAQHARAVPRLDFRSSSSRHSGEVASVEMTATIPQGGGAVNPVECIALSVRDAGAVALLEVGVSSPAKSGAVASMESDATTPQQSGAAGPVELEQPKNPIPGDGHLFESFYERKPPVWARWGLPPVKVVRGVARNVRFSNEDDDAYAASLEVDGQRVEIDSSSSIGIDAGDHLTLGGYEREGKLLALAYHNDSKGAHSDLRRLRRGYRFLFTIGWTSLLAGLGAVAGTVILLILRQRVGAFDSGLWGFAPYALSGLAAAVVSYFGLGLSFLGARAKEFHDAMNPSRAWQK